MSKPRTHNNLNPADSVLRKAISLKEKDTFAFQENVKIYLRVKPQLPAPSQTHCLQILGKQEVQVTPPSFTSEADRVYSYQEVFGPEANNAQVFSRTMGAPIQNVLSGYNSTVFIYGMTGAGKTFTMFNSSEASTGDRGLVGSTIQSLFQEIRSNRQHQFEVRLSFFQIYNENIRDLLSQDRQPLVILEDPLQGVVINQLKEAVVSHEAESWGWVQQGMNRRAREATKNNISSSRSHALLQLTIRKSRRLKGESEASVQESKMFLVDLAGNEKASQNESKRFVEGVNINKSLLTLGKCINLLSENKKNGFIPYRDSKLTRILKDSLGGNSKTVMIACVSSEERFYEETLNTIKYSSKARQIKNKGNGCLVRKIPLKKEQLQHAPQTSISLQEEQKIFEFVNAMESILSEKIRVEQVQEELSLCLHEDQYQKRLSPSKVKEVLTTLGKIRQKHQSILQSLEDQIQSFFGTVSRIKQNSSTASSSQGNRGLKHKDSHLQQGNRQMKGYPSEFDGQLRSEGSCSLAPVCLSQPDANCSHESSIHERFHKKEAKKKNPVSIKIESCKNSNKQNIPFNSLKRTQTSHSSLKSDRFPSKPRQKPIAEISKENFKLQSPTLREHVLIRSDSNPSTGTATETQALDFINRLKELDRNASCSDSSNIEKLLGEFDREGYPLGRLQLSMISKLRFMVKSRERPMGKREVVGISLGR